ncbi:MAG: glycosyltransferase family 39 protein [bacterium]|nr:glycosyltransferase family 39 protein [bacterium]
MKKTETIFRRFVLGLLLLLSMDILYISLKNIRFTSVAMKRELSSKVMLVSIIILGMIILGGVIASVYKGIQVLSLRNVKIISACLFLCIMLAELFYVTFITKAYPRSDNYTVLTSAMEMARNGHFQLQNSTGYFSQYTNNYFIVFLLYGFFRVILFFHIENLWNAVIALNIIMIDLAVLVTYMTVKKMHGQRQAGFVMFLTAICPTTYEWITFTYTNTLSLPFCMLLLYLAIGYKDVTKRKWKVLHLLLMALLAGIGYLIRATIIIPVVAVSIYFLFQTANGKADKKAISRVACTLGIFLLGFFYA